MSLWKLGRADIVIHMEATNTLRIDQVATLANGIEVRIIGLDSDPRCDVHVVRTDDPDQGMFVPRKDFH